MPRMSASLSIRLCMWRGVNAFAMVPSNLPRPKNLFEAHYFRKAKESNTNWKKTLDVWGDTHAGTRRDSARIAGPGGL